MIDSSQAGTVIEPERRVPVCGRYDVVVAGGGIAGVAAAIAAARNGASVCLIEKNCSLGGLATVGNVIVWLPICDGKGRQVCGGLAEELLKLSVHDLRRDNKTARFTTIPACWQPGGGTEERKSVRYKVHFNPSSYLLALEQAATDAGVKLMYDTRICSVDIDNSRIQHLIIENKNGRSAIACGTVVDATGDADVCYLAGEQTESLDSNVLCGWFYTLHDNNGLHLHPMSKPYSTTAQKADAVGPFFRGDDAEDVTGHILGTREMIREKLSELRGASPETDIQIVNPPTIACFRMTRRLVGAFSLGMRNMHEWFDDAVGLTGDWRESGPVYAIPMKTLLGVKTRNLTVAGRCISADTTIWDATRAIPTCAVTGEAAGSASAMAALRYSGDLHDLPVTELQDQLKRQGALIDEKLVKPAEG